jgi:hypothetical protein
MNLPRLFDDKGRLLPDIDTAGLDADALKQLEAVRVAYYTNVEAQHAIDSEMTERANIASRLRDAQTFYEQRWPPQRFFDLWKQNFGRR